MDSAQADFTSVQEVQRYLDCLFPEAPEDAWLVISWLAAPQDFRSRWFRIADRRAAEQTILTLARQFNTYVGLGLRRPQCVPSVYTRGTSEDVLAIGGLWIECDHAAGIHAATNLPTPPALLAFIKQLPFQPSLLVDSGGGIHCYVLFKELWILDTPAEQEKAALLLRRFQRTLQVAATAQGWTIDSTADLARVLRPTGTVNYKDAIPKPVQMMEEVPQRYNPSDLADMPWLASIEDMYTPAPGSGQFPITLLAPIETGCAWLAHCRDDAATLPEPEWYAMLGIVGRCEDGERLAHELSRPYARYSPDETSRKLRHALEASGPRTCSTIRYDLNADVYCRTCPAWHTMKSPIKLGMPTTQELVTGTPAPPGWQHSNGQAAPTAGIPGPVRRDPEEQTPWYREEVQRYKNRRGIVEANDTTICAFLRNHSEWQGKLWWDDMGNKPMFEQGELSDYLITKIGALFGKRHLLPIRTDRILARCLTACCYENRHDPLIAYLDALPGWDGVPRLESWLMDCAGVVDIAYNRFVSRMLLVSMIARAYQPGCLYRYVIVFEGPEEFRKSSFVAALTPEKRWHLSLTSSFENKDVPMLIQGVWVAELTELDSMTRTVETRLKSFLSDTEDAYVPKWQLFRIAPKRRTIFVGTTNDSSWLNQTGNTRFFPVKIFHPMDVEQFILIREQLFAEAKLWLHDHPQDWWDIPQDVQEQAFIEREERRQGSVYESDLEVWLEHGRFELARRLSDPLITSQEPLNFVRLLEDFAPVANQTTWKEIASGFLRLDTPEKWADINRQRQIGQALKALGWRQKVVKTKERQSLRVWRKEPEAPF